MLVCLALSLAVVVGREVIQNWGDVDNDVLDSVADALAGAIGAGSAAAIAWAVAGRLARERVRDPVELGRDRAEQEEHTAPE